MFVRSLSPSIQRFALRLAAFCVSSALLAPAAFARASSAADWSAQDVLDPPAPPRSPGDEEMLCCFFSFIAAVFLVNLLFSWIDLKQQSKPVQDGAQDARGAQIREKIQILAIGCGMCLFGAVWAGARV